MLRKESWRPKAGVVLGMVLESILLGVPPRVLGDLVHRFLPLAAVDWRGDLVLCVGAGIYEELVFRMIAFAILSIILVDLAHMDRFWSTVIMVVVGGVLFSAYHYLGSEAFAWDTFVFRSLAGIYFGIVFLTRGFGVTVGSHAAYDIMVAFGR